MTHRWSIRVLVYGLLMAGSGSSMAADASHDLELGGARFDPRAGLPTLNARWVAPKSEGMGLYLVQFEGPIRRAWLEGLRATGLQVVQYIHPYSYVVWGDALALQRASSGVGVRYAGVFQPAWKVMPEQQVLNDAVRPTQVLRMTGASRAALDAVLAQTGAQLERRAPLDTHLELLQLQAPGAAYVELARLPDVYAVQDIPQDGGPRGESSNQSIVGAYGPAPSHTIVPGYADWLNQTGYDGDGVIVSIVDGGIRTTHLDLVSRMLPCTSAGGSPTSCTTANDSHGTHVAGAVAGTAATGTVLGGFLRGQGVAPGAQLVQQRYPSFLSSGGPGGMIANGMLTIFKETALSQGVVANNSWGPSGSPRGYDIPTQQIDMIARDANPDAVGAQPVLAVWSIMNGNGDAGGACAPSSLGSPDEAKNLFAVGSTKLLSGSSQVAAIFDISSNSAHGNACDGRRVPHIVAPGCSTDSTTSTSNTAHSNSFCGTSMASPVVSGASALYIEKYRTQHAGATPSPALVKAVFTVAAKNLQGFRNADNGVMGHRPDRFQGYGRIDLEAVMNPPQPLLTVEQGTPFTASGETWTATYQAADPDQPIRLMLSWSDAKGHGLGGTTPAWVNDLDLVVVADGHTYLGNQVGADGWSASGGSADGRNNLEAVYLQPAQHGGSVAVSVRATNIAADALNPYVPGDPAQDFALVCSNCTDLVMLGTADLAISASATPDPVMAGGTLTYAVQLRNLGPDAVTAVSVTLPLASGQSFVSGSKTGGAGTWTCTSTLMLATCTLDAGSLPMDAVNPVAELELVTVVALNYASATLSNTLQVTAPQYADAENTNNTAAVSTAVTAELLLRDGFE